MEKFDFYLIICLSLLLLQCNKEKNNVEINDCDTIGNYYEDGEHFIRRDLVSDDGVIDYNKLLDNYKGRKTVCNPLNN